ncbi:S41 family peptidase [Treponema sp. OMZ 840]|uniref:S41 family peptidase n=1 Tax=Treponema sp. OMZ 840 TaxID=244313 RepID=UPI003D911631
MTNQKNSPIVRSVLGTLFVLCFSFCILSFPAAFAQTSASFNAEKEVHTRQYMELLNRVYTYVLQNYVDEVDPQLLYEGALKGMMGALEDPYTAYLVPSQMRDLNDTTMGDFGGVGLSITKPVENTADKPAYVEVVSPIEDTPGWQAGIQPGDLIVSIDGTSTADITMEEVLKILRGPKDSVVNLIIKRGKATEFSVRLVRAIIEVPTVKYGMIDNGRQKTGYLRIIEFTPKTAERVQDALDSFKKAGFTSLIIDLRNNPGGLIVSVAEVADKFINKGVIVSTKSRLMFENSVYRASSKTAVLPENTPVVVLINKGSASASEILAGALKDYHLAYLVGERTYGKGSVQKVIPLPNSDGIKLTTARYYTPSDSNIDKIGIPPDKEVLLPALTEAEEKAYAALIADEAIQTYVASHPNMNETDIAVFARTLEGSYKLDLRLLRRLIRMEVNRTKTAELYDLDYDIQLIAALEILTKPGFDALVKSAKTLNELQSAAADDGKTALSEKIKSASTEGGKKK